MADKKDSFEPDSFTPDEAQDSFVADSFVPDEQKPGLGRRALDLAKRVITPIPVLAQAKEQVISKGEEVLEAAEPDIFKNQPDVTGKSPIVRAGLEALDTVRRGLVPIPTKKLARAQGELTIPASPLDLVGQAASVGLPSMVRKVAGSALDDVAGGISKGLDDVAGAGLPSEATGKVVDPLLADVQIQVREAIRTKSHFNAAMKSLKERRDSLYKTLIAKNTAASEYKAGLGEAPDPVSLKTLRKLEGEARNARQAVENVKAQMDELRVAREQNPIPALEPEHIAMPRETMGAPLPKNVPVAEPAVDHVVEASKYINLDRLKDEGAREVIAALSNDPKFVERLMKQKRGVVPLERSKAAGEKLGMTVDDFAGLKPGQLPKKGTLDAQTAAASAMQNMAGHDLYEVAKLRAQGVPIEHLAGRAAMNIEAIIGAQGVISETGRALGAVRLTTAERALVKASKVAFREGLMETPGKLDEFLKEIAALPSDAIAQRILAAKRLVAGEPPGLLAMLVEGRSAMLLSSPVTWVRNSVGNRLMALSNAIEAPLAGVADFMMAKLTGTPQQRLVGEGVANAFGMWNGVHKGAKDALKVLRDEASLAGFAADDALRTRAIPGKLGKAVRIPFRILSADDTFQKSIIGSAELSRQAYRTAALEGLTGAARAKRIERLLENPTEEMLNKAIAAAQEFSFTDKLDPFFGGLNQAINSRSTMGPVAKIFVPFLKTPVKVATRLLERTPIMSELTKKGVFRQAFFTKGATRGDVADAIARNLVGTMAITSASLALYANEGLITGAAPKDERERETLFATGWRPNSIKIGGIYIPYRGFEPASTYLAAVAEYAKLLRENPDARVDEKAVSILTQSAKSFLSQPFLKNIGDVIDAFENPSGGRARMIARGVAGSFVPSIVGSAARASDKTLRAPETIVEQMMANVPFLSQRVRAKLDRFGNPVTRTSFLFGLADKPLPANNPIEREMMRLEIPKAVGFPSNTLAQRSLNKDEYNELLTLAGKGIVEELEPVITDPAYAELPKEDQVAEVEKIVSRNRREAAELVRPKVVMRTLGFIDKLDEDELIALNQRVELPDFEYLKDGDRRKVVGEFLRELKTYR